MLLLNTERAVLLLVSVETNVCCSVLAGDKMELKIGKKRQLSLFFFYLPLLEKQMKQNDASQVFFLLSCCFFFHSVGASVVHEQMANDNITGS